MMFVSEKSRLEVWDGYNLYQSHAQMNEIFLKHQIEITEDSGFLNEEDKKLYQLPVERGTVQNRDLVWTGWQYKRVHAGHNGLRLKKRVEVVLGAVVPKGENASAENMAVWRISHGIETSNEREASVELKWLSAIITEDLGEPSIIGTVKGRPVYYWEHPRYYVLVNQMGTNGEIVNLDLVCTYGLVAAYGFGFKETISGAFDP